MKSFSHFFDFKNKTVVVTGGAMGIGLGIVKRFYDLGANVVIADIDEQAGNAQAEELGSRALFVSCDVSDEKSVKNLVNEATKHFGAIDILVNNAGIFPSKQLLDASLDFWEKVQSVNLRGSFLCAREAARVMVKQGRRGVIIQVGSIDSLHPSRIGLAAYDASKHGVW